MSRVSLIEQLYTPKKKSALEFNYDALWAPPIRFFLSQQDINELYKIATSLKYNDNIEKKYELIDAVMRPRGFKRGNCGTNRVVYNFLEDTSFCMKIALDRVGINDSPREYKNQEFFKPFCCKIFEVDPTGVIACVERVNPISSLEEFLSISDDVFNMMITKIIGKYVVDDLGSEKFMNYGIRYNSNGIAFGPVVLDYPYAYELDGAKLHCAKPIQIGNKEFACGGEIDYDAGLNNLVCCKCGRTYSARELAKDDSNVLKFYSDNDQSRMRARIVRGSDGTIVKDSGRSSKLYVTKEEYEEGTRLFELENLEPRRVGKTIKNKHIPIKKLREQYYTELQLKAHEEMEKRNAEPFNPVVKSEFSPRPAKRANRKEEVKNNENSILEDNVYMSNEYEIPRVRRARRAENLGQDIKECVNELKTEPEESKTYNDNFNQTERFLTMDDVDTLKELVDYLPEQESECDISEDELKEIIDRNNNDWSKIVDELNLRNNTESNDLNTAIVEALHEAAKEKVCFGYPEDDEDDDEELDFVQQHDKVSVKMKIAHVDTNKNRSMICASEMVKDIIDSKDIEDNSDTESDVFNEEMEADVFPEIYNQGISVGINLIEDTDYSNYEPSEDNNEDNYNYYENDEDDYSDYFKVDRKEKKRNKKQQNAKKYSDMSDY